MAILLGAVADDFTGATDVSNTLARNGMRTLQAIGIPPDVSDFGDAEAVVVALKTRMAPAAEAVADSLSAAAWLRSNGARQIVFKYCSTFDSTAQGNIGPVADALAQFLNSNMAIVCPAFPGAGRTIYKGYLFVGDQLLSDSPMKDHPLTPMSDSSLIRLMSAQTNRRVGLVSLSCVEQGPEKVSAAIKQLSVEGCSYAVVDALVDAHLEIIGSAVADHLLITGGSGVATGLPANFRRSGLLGEPVNPDLPRAQGSSLVIAGSCSEATRSQIAFAKDRGWSCMKLDPHQIAAGEAVADDAMRWARTQPPGAPIVIYGSADPDEVAAVQARYGRKQAGDMIEGALAAIAVKLVAADRRRLIIAGGETSGAVVSALGIGGLKIGPEIDPGVPWTETTGELCLALALKSGNFGAADFFEKAFRMLP